MEIEIDPKFMDKVVDAQFNNVRLGWFRTIYYYCIDSKLRTTKRLDEFLQEQIENPSTELKELAAKLRTDDIDETIINILKWAKENINYEYDSVSFDRDEFWNITQDTITLKKGDCDDINSLIYVLARLCEIPPYVIYCAIGDCFGGGHFWVLYYSTRHDKLVAIDGTYYPSMKSVEERPEFKFSPTKYQGIWYLFSDKYIYKYGN